MKYIDVEIDGNGEVVMKAEGFEGPECEEFTKAIEEALGVTLQRKRTPDFYHNNTLKNKEMLRG